MKKDKRGIWVSFIISVPLGFIIFFIYLSLVGKGKSYDEITFYDFFAYPFIFIVPGFVCSLIYPKFFYVYPIGLSVGGYVIGIREAELSRSFFAALFENLFFAAAIAYAGSILGWGIRLGAKKISGYSPYNQKGSSS